jgi:hypothetical protein
MFGHMHHNVRDRSGLAGKGRGFRAPRGSQ